MNLQGLDGGNTSPRESLQTTKTIKSKETKTTIGKKLVEIGHKEYIDAETGEVRDFSVISMEDKDFNFQKIWLGHILEAIQEVGNAKMKVLMYLLANRNKSNNSIIKTAEKMGKEIGITRQTVSETLKILEQYNIIKRVTGAVYLNPDVIFKGSKNKRMGVILEYHGIDDNDEYENVTFLQDEVKKYQEIKKREDLKKREAELLAELADLRKEIEEE